MLLAAGAGHAEAVDRTLVLLDVSGGILRPAFDYLIDDTGTFALADVLDSEQFQPAGRDGLTLGYLRAAVWLRFSVLDRSAGDGQWLLSLAASH